MTIRSAVNKITENDPLNFALTNRIPRRTLTRFMGWFSKTEQPVVRDLSIAAWRLFCDVDLSDARKTRFRSLHDAFIRELKEGSRPIDPAPDVLVSPCDAIVGAHGTIAGNTLLQVKGSSYTLEELLRDARLVSRYQNGRYATLRLTAGMYHRFHAPHDCRVERVTHISGDVWNVNPATLKRIDKVYCKNERAVLELELAECGSQIVLVAVAAVLVAGIRLTFADITSSRDRTMHPTDARFRKGDELGWFEHGSTILVLAPVGYEICAGVAWNAGIRMGEPLFRRSPAAQVSVANPCQTTERQHSLR
jgi:phosphatidylserine decarboxylase